MVVEATRNQYRILIEHESCLYSFRVGIEWLFFVKYATFDPTFDSFTLF